MIFKEVGVYMISLNSLVTCVTFQVVYSFVLSVIAITLSILMANFLKGSSILKNYYLDYEKAFVCNKIRLNMGIGK